MYELVGAINEGKFCDFAKPVPKELHIVAGRVGADDNPEQIALEAAEKANLEKYGYSTWYEFCVNEWGTKWDVDPYDKVEYDDQHDKNGVTFGFDSAWAPPCGVYEALIDQGYTVRAYYYESGMGFCGIYDENGDDYYDITAMTSEQIRESIPTALDDCMGISETVAEYEEETNEDQPAEE
jgi:hypothetical protein